MEINWIQHKGVQTYAFARQFFQCIGTLFMSVILLQSYFPSAIALRGPASAGAQNGAGLQTGIWETYAIYCYNIQWVYANSILVKLRLSDERGVEKRLFEHVR